MRGCTRLIYSLPGIVGVKANEVYIPERDLLIAYHTMYDGNVVIDCKARKRIAQYAPPKLGVRQKWNG